MRSRFIRLPPGGGRIGRGRSWAALRVRDPDRTVREELCARLGAGVVTLHASGREALRVALGHLAKQSGRSEVVVPAYTCFSVPASAVAAGLRVRLVDVTAEGQIDRAALAKLPLERAAALVVSNLLGLAEPIAPLRALLDSAGVALVDDAAQSIGARSSEGPVGGRGDVGLLSFGRGKPLSALGGGALAWPPDASPPDGQAPAPPRRAMALSRAATYDLARVPRVFRALAAVPVLGVGETVYDPGFRRGGIDGASLCLAAVLLPHLDADIRIRQAVADNLAARVREETSFVPLAAVSGSSAYPRLGLIAPSARARDEALGLLTRLGATRLYPSPLDRVGALRPHRAEDEPCPGAHEFASRLLTLPTHEGLRPRHVDEVVRILGRLD
jgi:dTDP-4-amino-4,6-dideoxygalactose transaminase